MPRRRKSSTTSHTSSAGTEDAQELASMYDYLAKIILIGPSAAGKSCILHRLTHAAFTPSSTAQTIGVEFATHHLSLGHYPRRTRLKLQLWDTAGTERFRSVSRSYYRGAAGALLVYDVTNADSFAACNDYLRDARALASPRLAVVLVGNKSDVGRHERVVRAEDAEAWAERVGIELALDVSAKDGRGVEEAFIRLAGIILARVEMGDVDPNDPLSGLQYGDGVGGERAGSERKVRLHRGSKGGAWLSGCC